MRIVALAVVLLVPSVAPAAAQSRRVYLSGQLAADIGSRGPIDLDAFATAGGLIGLRVSGAWSLEFEIDRGFAESSERILEGRLLAQVSGPGPYSQDELDRRGVFGRSAHESSAATGYSAHVVWKSHDPARVNVALMGGLSWRTFDRLDSVDITSVGPDVTYPAEHPNLRSFAETRPLTGGGLTAGFMVPIRVRGALTVAPEVRITGGVITDESKYLVLHTGVRVMWGF